MELVLANRRKVTRVQLVVNKGGQNASKKEKNEEKGYAKMMGGGVKKERFR